MDINKFQPITHTTRPIVTGTSVVAIRTDNFVMIAADTLGSYGSMARFHNMERIKQVSSNTLLGAGGEISDFQNVCEYLDGLDDENYCYDDDYTLDASSIHSFLTRICYNRRSKIDPFYNEFVIAGLDENNKTYLGYTDLFGTTYKDNYVVTGFGSHFGRPILRKEYSNDLTLNDGKKLLATVMRVLFYRDCRTINKITFGYCDVNGIKIDDPISIQTNWDLSEITPVKKEAFYDDDDVKDDANMDVDDAKE